MEKNKLAQALTMENFITNWNGDFPDHPLVAEDLKKPHSLMGALFLVLDRLGIDRDAVLAPPPEEERNEHIQYYWDLIPVINMTRIINHLVSVMPQMKAKINITHFLQPVPHTSHSILLLLFNLMLFNEERLRGIAESEEELFAKSGQVKTLEDKKNKLLEKLNEQAEEKGKRADRVEKLEMEIKQYEEELKNEKETHEIEKQELDAVLKENQKLKLILEQKRTQKESLLTDIENKKEQRVYDADEIKSKAAQAALNVQDADEKLNSLQAKLLEKENNLKNLQIIKPQIDATNTVLQEIVKLSESLKEYETGDLESDSKDGELYVLQTTLQELQAQLADLTAAREEFATKHEQARTRRQQERMLADNALHEAEEKDKQSRERSNKAMQRTTEIKEAIKNYEAMKARGVEEVAKIKSDFTHEIKSIDEALLSKIKEVEKNIENKLRDRKM